MGKKGTLARAPAAAAAGLLVLFATACGVSHAATQPAAASRAAAGGPAVPSPGLSSSLQGVTCISARNCWAVGSYVTAAAQQNEILHWDGARWSGIATPSHGSGPGDHSSLSAVACTSARNCWAVGSYDHGAGPLNQALHWDGTSWSRVATPDPGVRRERRAQPERRQLHVAGQLLGGRDAYQRPRDRPECGPALGRRQLVRGQRPQPWRERRRGRPGTIRRRLPVGQRLPGRGRLRQPGRGRAERGAGLEREPVAADRHPRQRRAEQRRVPGRR